MLTFPYLFSLNLFACAIRSVSGRPPLITIG